ncbi:copper oxidase [Mucilaginibacter sp. MD40]|uniref:multicopper oxidase domain-containing protein n=1 Tax=Mucilaginibacter sp. MD40 TaxID=2029590 RepID=UPI000BAC831C|nr:multicopper oxidase domain-containing protein [Mucilaginibacter sp. MD40]PAW95357.1 copper oxidase [Mucilaginibacter sp. MD40]
MKKILIIVVMLFLKQLVFAQTDMQNMAGMQKTQPVTYTCPMHPEIHASKPGNCPKCGMKLVKEKVKAVSKKTPGKQPTMKDPAKKADDMDGMKMGEEKPKAATEKSGDMTMPMKGTEKKTDNMGGMKMGDSDAAAADIKSAKANLGPIKTINAISPPRTVRYDLYIKDTTVMLGKKPKRAIAVNGQIPMPTLTFTEGDTAEIWVHNELNEETSLHWHGLFLPNRYDGVPFLTQMPIKPHTKYLYKFPIIQHGTHWYHSHSGLQEQIGMYGAFIMNKRQEWDIPTIPVVLSDWIDMNPKEVNRSLHNQTDWFGIRKNTIQSYSEAIKTGHLKTKLANEWKRMLAMDVSDVAYDSFLINGKNQSSRPEFKAGDKVRLRIANGGASSYFWLKYAGGKITVVATDGNDVEPVEVDRLLIAVSETYDVVVTIPDNKSYEFLVTPEDRTKSASLWLGSGQKVPAGKMPTLKYFAGMKMMNEMMDMKGNMVKMDGMEMANQTMDMNTVMYPEITGYEKDDKTKGSKGENGTGSSGITGENADRKDMDMKRGKSEAPRADSTTSKTKAGKTDEKGEMKNMGDMHMDNTSSDIVTLNYAMLKAPEKTTLRPGPLKTLYFELTGNMNRYVWSINNKVVSETDKILIKKGENVRIVLYNNTMMRHPMHLHGHDFRLLNGQGEYAIMKNVIDIMPMERDTIEFAATEPGGDWFFHCHILYHMMSGMGRVFSYQDTLIDKTDITSAKVAKRGLNSDDRHYHSMARIGLESSGSDGMAMLSNTRNTIATAWHLGIRPEMGEESETTIGRYLGRMQWWRPFIGFDYHYKKEGPNGEQIMRGIMGRNIFGNDKRNLLGQVSNKDNRSTMTAGIQYLLPMNVISEFRADLDGKLRFQFSREDIPLTPRLRSNFMINTDKEYALGLRYIVTKYFNLSTHYDSDMGLGAGLTVTY